MEDVELLTRASLLRHDGTDLPVQVLLRYQAADPYAVMFAFLSPGETSWLFARDLLDEGLARFAGLGDVRIWPGPRSGTLLMALSSPDGNALFEFSASAVRGFLQRAYVCVHSGRESDYIDMDQVVMDLLDGRSKYDT